ncbi:hypothetical protein ACGF13_31055 [Kitasatospora sp. NPDC048286]|uniref:hypothetical protein n=1 Tax=unclassified Kitasatospora TaxID=2633591 RepID=UPI00371A8AF3
MAMTRRVSVAAAGAALISAFTAATAVPAAADCEDPPTAARARFFANVRNEGDGTYLYHPIGNYVQTLDSISTAHPLDVTWDFQYVGETDGGTGIYAIRSDGTTSCITNNGLGNRAILAPCDKADLAQQWAVTTAQEHSAIVNMKFKNTALRSNGTGNDVTLVSTVGPPTRNQLWTFSYVGQ